jgi:predicted acyltransferase
VLGSNSILMYMISELLGSTLNLIAKFIHGGPFNVQGWVFTHWFARIPAEGLASFAYSFTYLAVCFVPIWICYRKKIFLKV